MRELVIDLLGKAELLVRILKDFHASSVSLVMRDLFRVFCKVATCSGVKDFGGVVGRLMGSGEEDEGFLLRSKRER